MHRPAGIPESMKLTPAQASQRFTDLFGSVFLCFHRRGPKRSAWTPQGWAVLQHLEMAGPLTVTEAARHMERAQSVMSEMVGGLERKGLLARMRDARDRRRTLVWLTDEGRRAMARERQVLCPERLERAFRRLDGDRAATLLTGMAALVEAADRESSSRPFETSAELPTRGMRAGTERRKS
jgi:DNA-binding MarR family transcriptional regulator